MTASGEYWAVVGFSGDNPTDARTWALREDVFWQLGDDN